MSDFYLHSWTASAESWRKIAADMQSIDPMLASRACARADVYEQCVDDVKKYIFGNTPTYTPTYKNNCPYCGSADNNIELNVNYPSCLYVECLHCNARGPVAGDPVSAWEYWNDSENNQLKNKTNDQR
jgi:hypothetical protein